MTEFGIYLRAQVGGVGIGDKFKPSWVMRYDPDAFEGRGFVDVTDDESEALRFDTFEDALNCWRRQSVVKPLREDGHPNRPLTAFTAEVRKLKGGAA